MISVKSNGKILLQDKESNFYLQELVPKATYERFGVKSIWFLDPRLINTLQFVREYFGKAMTVNNWHSGGSFQFRGLRTDDFYYKFVGNKKYESVRKGKMSQHRFGRAIDCNFSGLTPEEARTEILSNEGLFLDAGMTTIEDGAFSPTWLHFDIRHTELENILIVKP